MQSLSRIYEFGVGVERDLDKARFWEEKAEKVVEPIPEEMGPSEAVRGFH